MQINPDINPTSYTFKSYDTGKVTIFEPITAEEAKISYETATPASISTLTLTKSAIIMADTLINDWATDKTAHQLDIGDYQTILDLKPELVILGTGKNIHFPNAKDMLVLQQNGIGVEVMGTAAACRTYNFLISDGRNVACAFFMIED